MGAYYYGNINGIYRGVGNNKAELLMHASRAKNNLMFCRLSENSMCGELRPQQNAMASSVCFQAGVYPKNSTDFLMAKFFQEEKILKFIQTEQVPELEFNSEKPDWSSANDAAIDYLCAALTQKVFFGGELPELVLDASNIPFETQVRELAYWIFSELPSRVTEGCCVCTEEMQTTDEIRQIIRLFPAESSSETAVRASNCKEKKKEIRSRVVEIVDFWHQNRNVVCMFEQSCSSFSDWETIRKISSWENGCISDADMDELNRLLHEKADKCWGDYLTNLAQKPELQEKLAEREMQRLDEDSSVYYNATSLVSYITKQLSLFQDNQRRCIAEYANNLYLEHSDRFADNSASCCHEIEVYHSATHLQEELKEGYTHTLDRLYSLLREDLQQQLAKAPSVQTLKRCLADLPVCEYREVQEIRRTLCNQIAEESTDQFKLLRELKYSEQDLKSLLEEPEYISLFDKVNKNCEQRVLFLASRQNSLEQLRELFENNIFLYQQVVGDNPNLLEQVFFTVCRNDSGLDYDELYDNREIVLRFISKTQYQQILNEKVITWKIKKRTEIKGIVDELYKNLKRIDSYRLIRKSADDLNAILSRCDDDSDLRMTVRNELNQMLKRINPNKEDPISLFDPLKELCDIQIWRDRFNKKTDDVKPKNSVHTRNNTRDLLNINNQISKDSFQSRKAAHQPQKATCLPRKGSFLKGFARMEWKAKVVAVGILMLLISVIIFGILGIVNSAMAKHRAVELNDAYQAWKAGQGDALTKLEQLGEIYEPACIVAELIHQSNTIPTFETNPQQTAPMTSQLPSQVTKPEPETTEPESESESVIENESESEANQTDVELERARSLWNDGIYTEAKKLFDTLAAEDLLTFDTTGDLAELEYGALCSLQAVLDISQEEDYGNLLVYLVHEQKEDAAFDFEKPIYCLITDIDKRYLCAYDRQTHRYQLWCSEEDDEKTVLSFLENAEKQDLLSMRRILMVQDDLQQR